MNDKKETKEVLQDHGKRRREFVGKSAKLAAAAPAVALLLSQASKPAHAVDIYETAPP